MGKNWPLRYSALSSDGRLIAVAGKRGLVHYSSTSGRWKLFSDERQEQAFVVKGGMVWFHHVLIAAVEVSKSYQVASPRSCCQLLTHLNVLRSGYTLETQNLPTKMSYIARSLHPPSSYYLWWITPCWCTRLTTTCTITWLSLPLIRSKRTSAGRSISMGSSRARARSEPSAGCYPALRNVCSCMEFSCLFLTLLLELGDPVDDLAVATVLMMVGGKLVLLRPRKVRSLSEGLAI